MLDINRSVIIEKSKCRDVCSICVYLIPTNLVCVLFGIVIPTSSFNFVLMLTLWMIMCSLLIGIIVPDSVEQVGKNS